MAQDRIASVSRKTRETEIEITINLDGSGQSEIDSGIGFFDHMLEGFARHGFFDLKAQVKGDLGVDCHHTIEDTGIVLGRAIRQALGDKRGIRRYGSCILPMDEVLVLSAVDLSGRPYLQFDPVFYALSYSAMMNLHVKMLTEGNCHHMIEAIFKAFAKALDQAVSFDPRIEDVLSTKGEI